MMDLPIPNPEQRWAEFLVHHLHAHTPAQTETDTAVCANVRVAKYSKVWLYFIITDADNAHCHKCNKSFAYKSRNANTLKTSSESTSRTDKKNAKFQQPSMKFL